MSTSSTAERLTDGLGPDRHSFLGSHRALAACTREFGRLADEVVKLAGALPEAADERPVVRRSPDRCIVQLGPVALTVGWLRSTLDSAADGQLLVVVWRGTVAPRGDHRYERPSKEPPRVPATMQWEASYRAEATSEAAWGWRAANQQTDVVTSSELAMMCIRELKAAHAEAADAL